MLVQKGEVGGYDYFLRPDISPPRDGAARPKLQNPAFLINIQAARNMREKFNRVELSLLRKLHCPGHGKGKGKARRKIRPEAKRVQREALLLQNPHVVHGIYEGVLFLKITVDFPAELLVAAQSRLVSLEIELSPLMAELFYELVIDKPVLGGNFRRGILCDTGADAAGFQKNIIYPGFLQGLGAENAGNAAADDEHVGLSVSLKAWKGRKRRA